MKYNEYKVFMITYDDGCAFVPTSNHLRDFLLSLVESDSVVVSAAYKWSLECEPSSEFFCPEFQIIRYA